MAIISCPECKKEISNQATACPACGYPIRAVVIEHTAKKWKSLELSSVLFLCIGVVFIIASFSSGSAAASIIGTLLIFGGFIGYIISRFKAWWHHG